MEKAAQMGPRSATSQGHLRYMVTLHLTLLPSLDRAVKVVCCQDFTGWQEQICTAHLHFRIRVLTHSVLEVMYCYEIV